MAWTKITRVAGVTTYTCGCGAVSDTDCSCDENITVPELPTVQESETRLAAAYTALKLAQGYDWGCGHPHLDRYQAEVQKAESLLADARHIASRR